MSLNFTASNPAATNSVSYADVSGLLLGLDRLQGENTTSYVDRLFRAAANRRDHSLQGTIDEISFHLGLRVRPGVSVTLPSGSQIICEVGRVTVITNGATVLTIPTFTIADDSYIEWKNLSDVVTELNAAGFSASLLIEDAPALQLVKQTNVFVELNEPVGFRITRLAHQNIVSYQFSQQVSVSSFDMTAGLITLANDPPSDLTISYFYSFNPAELVCSDVALLGLTDPSIKDVAVKNGALAYQFLEFIQTIMAADRSYWAQ